MHSIIVQDPPLSGNEYTYAYDIEDLTTGDRKSQHEVRQGNIVSGAYSVLDPDGTRRTVHYTADPKHGFKAVVTQEPVRDVAVVRQPYIRTSHELPTDNSEFTYPYDSVLQDYKTDIGRYGQISLPVRQSRVTFFTPVNELKNDKRKESRQYFTPNYSYRYPSN